MQAGPGDTVRFVLQVANVGYGPAQALRMQAILSDGLEVQFVECVSCTSSTASGRLRIDVDRLAPGEQSQLRVSMQVAQDAWPGQNLQLVWSMAAMGLPDQSVLTGLELPWAALPATGCPPTLDGRLLGQMPVGSPRGLPR